MSKLCKLILMYWSVWILIRILLISWDISLWNAGLYVRIRVGYAIKIMALCLKKVKLDSINKPEVSTSDSVRIDRNSVYA